MGNSVSSQCVPYNTFIEHLSEGKGNSVDSKMIKQKPICGSVLRTWRYFPDPKNSEVAHCEPVDLSAFTQFHNGSCYIILHTFLSPPYQLNVEPTAIPPSPTNPLCSSLEEVVISARQHLSPKGQLECFSGLHHKLSHKLNGHTTPIFYYDIYIWHGKIASQTVKKNALGAGFQVETKMKAAPNSSKLLSAFFDENETILPLHTILNLDNSITGQPIETANELFYVVRSFNEQPVPLRVKKTSRVKELKRKTKKKSKSKGNLKETKSTDSLGSSEYEEEDEEETMQYLSSSKSKRSSVKNRSLSKGQLHLEQNKKVSARLPRHASMSEKINFKSMSLPSSDVQRAKMQPLFNLNLSELSDTSETNRTASLTINQAPESQASKIARCDKLCSQITDFLYLGSDTVARNKKLLKQNNITHVLNCASTICENYHPNDFIYKPLHLCDARNEDIACLFYDVLEFIDNAILSGGSVFVHCHQGVSRSSSMIIVYLMWKNKTDFLPTHELVKRLRCIANPNAGFTCQLLKWQKDHAQDSGKDRLYGVFAHHLKAKEQFTLKELQTGLLTLSSLDPRGAFVIRLPDRLYVWIGKNCPAVLEENAFKFADRLQRFEEIPTKKKVKQDKESKKFLALFSDIGPIAEVDAYSESYSILS